MGGSWRFRARQQACYEDGFIFSIGIENLDVFGVRYDWWMPRLHFTKLVLVEPDEISLPYGLGVY